MISFIKDFYVAHQSEPIENVDQLFLNENFEDSKLYKSKFHASYMQMKKLEKKSRVLFEENSNNSSKIRGLENRLSISVDALEYKIDGVKKVCLEELKLQADKIEDTIKTRGKETDDKLSKHDIELDKLRLGIEEQQIKLKTHENSQVELRIELERKILKKMKSKLEKQKRRYDNQINLVKIEMKKQKEFFEQEIRKTKEDQKEETRSLHAQVEQKVELIAGNQNMQAECLDQLKARQCCIF